MTVRSAVAKAETAATEAAARPSTAVVVRQAIEAQSASFRQVLPRHVDPDRFARLTLTAVKSAPELMACFGTDQGRTSVLIAAMQAATIGLEPNTPTQECWILPRKEGKVQEARLMIGYRGLLKLARRSGTIQTIYAEVVRDQDHFMWSRGLAEDRLEFIPAEGERGELTHAYAVARFLNGGYQFVVLDRLMVEARRAMSDSWRSDKGRPHSPWTKWPEAMWRKSAIRALVPFLDLAPEAEAALHREERPLRFDPETGVIESGAFLELPPADDDGQANTEAKAEDPNTGPGTEPFE